MSDIYREEILDHAKNPRNQGKLSEFDFEYKENNPVCGDTITLQIKLDEQKQIKEIAFTGGGCTVSQAAASMLFESVKGKTMKEIEKLSSQDVLDIMGIETLTPSRMKCALLSLEALKKGIIK
ncbi:SUF system NifU family Fe-S cluster assembly protein [Patescibacteria group bacterium]|nr:SUF system NifU family Fe-S cluster assembly protein [Patescibacteria group bacterium]MBU1075611.1 SUF system NifU family Fe-S cluster assembly protein [Patescibacteria group bacterium]MBU1951560.1 SUF system NifU family Fe-S cluster assembly protein [Patescibacteria group bacterium]MBU2228981.1 SUF system NifU family Fe-S cluster assembly protein [Patescibacteria group bacterium]